MAAEPGIAAVGVGLPGLVDLDGVVHYAPNLPGFVGVAARERLAAACPVPVVVDNDANVAALGEVLHGAGRGHREVLVVTLGTGIGGGLVFNGAVHRGGYGLAAEIGHFVVDPDGPVCACGARGHWEAIASGSALGRRAREWAARGDAPERPGPGGGGRRGGHRPRGGGGGQGRGGGRPRHPGRARPGRGRGPGRPRQHPRPRDRGDLRRPRRPRRASPGARCGRPCPNTSRRPPSGRCRRSWPPPSASTPAPSAPPPWPAPCSRRRDPARIPTSSAFVRYRRP